MSKTHYGYDIRTALCLNCGAPLDVDVQGGKVVCEYCATPNLVRRRRDHKDQRHKTIIAQRPAIPESERLRQLARQDFRPLQLPPALQAWARNGELLLHHQKPALQSWLQYCMVMRRGGGTIEAQYLFALTLLLSPTLEDRHERALLENAVDVLPDINHRNIIRCRLAHHAAVEGDQQAAEKWLSPVDPRPRDLMADTAYRFAVCYIALTRGQPQGVFQQLGQHEGDVPIFDGYDEEAFLLRCHALEAKGEQKEAFRRIGQRLTNSGHFAPLLALARRNPRLQLCPKTLPRLEKAQWTLYDRQLRPPRYDFGSIIVFVVAFGMAGGVLAWLLTAVNWAASPLRGEDIAMVFGIGWVVPACLFVAARAFRASRRNVSMHDHGVPIIARVLAAQPTTNPETHAAVTKVLAGVVHEGVAYEVTAQLDVVRPALSGEHPALFDPQERHLKMVAPSVAPPPVIMPFG